MLRAARLPDIDALVEIEDAGVEDGYLKNTLYERIPGESVRRPGPQRGL